MMVNDVVIIQCVIFERTMIRYCHTTSKKGSLSSFDFPIDLRVNIYDHD